jgi:adenylylsulfate kinase
MSDNIFKHHYDITQKDRCQLNQHGSIVIWFTGLPCSGKSTLANELDKTFYAKGIRSYVLDGDNVRKGLNADLTFSAEDRKENLRRIGHVAQLFTDAGIVCIAAFVAPLQEDRAQLKANIGSDRFFEIYLNTPIETCEERDIKGLYKKARNGEIKDFTGVNAPYENPENPDLIIDTSKESMDVSIERIMSHIRRKITINIE